MTALRVILIGGTSNVGKSTLAAALSAKLGWRCVSTDSLARHPGRPWGNVKPHVAEHYLTLSTEELIADVLRHYAGMWPGIRTMIAEHASDASAAAERLILEGSALWPESLVEVRDHAGVAAVWLTASDGFLQERIRQVSGYEHAGERERAMIESFIARTKRYNQRMMEAVTRLGLPWLDVEAAGSLEELREAVLDRVGGAG